MNHDNQQLAQVTEKEFCIPSIHMNSALRGATRMNNRLLATIALVSICTGCANMATIDRTSLLPNDGRAIHLDAPQRLVYSDRRGNICAEPTPDALQAYVSSFGGGVGVPTQGSASIAQAFQTNAASIGLHSQSITLMRDTLYRICEASHNDSLNPGDVVQLLERSQDLTLGVLAIEQLTGAVVARQAQLGGNANASASANIANTQAALDSVRKAEEYKKKALNDAQTAQKSKSDLVVNTRKALDAEKAKPMPDQSVVTTLTDKLKTQEDDLGKANDTVTAAKDAYVKAQQATQVVLDNFNAAIVSASAAATGTGSFASGTDRTNIDKDTVAQIAQATMYIVATIVQKGHVTDTCINIMTKYAAETNPDKQAALKPIFDQCSTVITTYLKAYSGSLKAGTQGSIPISIPNLPAPQPVVRSATGKGVPESSRTPPPPPPPAPR